ncbi:MAG: helix-turn-helix transcriptional regulator [Bacteroidaceae bacterium]|nr:helix-turn-helix transcriptional regulator [Bacteroidaceae bacterium]
MAKDIQADCGYTLHRVTPDTLTSTAMKVGFLGIGLCTRGTARIMVNVDTYDMHANNIVVILPNSLVHISDVSPDWEAKLICVTRMELLRDAAAQILPFVKDARSMQKFLFQERENIVSSFHSIYNFLNMLLRDEYTVSKYEQGVCVFRCLMLGMRDKSTHYRTKGDANVASSASLNVFNQFMLLVNEHCKSLHTVDAYADQLHISPQYLGRICRMYDVRGPKEIIDDLLILQLKSTIKNTTKTMKEICYEYNFSNLSFMSTYFRRHTGFTPKEFRNKYRDGTL